MRRTRSFASTGLACLAVLLYKSSLCSTQVAVSPAREQEAQGNILLTSTENDQSPNGRGGEKHDAFSRKKRTQVATAQKESYSTASPETPGKHHRHLSLTRRRRQGSSGTPVSGSSLSPKRLLARRYGTPLNLSLALTSVVAAIIVFWRLGIAFWTCLEHPGTALVSAGTTPRQLGESDVKPKKHVRFADCIETIITDNKGQQAEAAIDVDDDETYRRRRADEPAPGRLAVIFVSVILIAAGLSGATYALVRGGAQAPHAGNHTSRTAAENSTVATVTGNSKEATAGMILGLALFFGVAVKVIYSLQVVGLEARRNPQRRVGALSLYKIAYAFLFLFITSFLIFFSTEPGRVASGGIYLLFVVAAGVLVYLAVPLVFWAFHSLLGRFQIV